MRRRQSAISAEKARALWDARASADDGMTVQCQLVTPMYGGGVKAGQVDEAMPIRTSGIRGQLRFWWRLLYGADRSSERLFEDECKLWGGIASGGPKASKVALRVDCEPDPPVGESGLPPYVLILEGNESPKLLKEGYSFKLLLRFDRGVTDQQRFEVLESLRWWASFGGVGARTRRGLGALKASSGQADLKPVSSDEVQKLCGWIVIGPTTDPRRAWETAVGALQKFRQGPGVGRRSGSSGPGGSHWPEANVIRQLADKAGPAGKGVDVSFPRAAFGLPIVFQFKGETCLNDTLEGKGHERMASPLILRPYFDGERYAPMALLLPGWRQRISMAVTLK